MFASYLHKLMPGGNRCVRIREGETRAPLQAPRLASVLRSDRFGSDALGG